MEKKENKGLGISARSFIVSLTVIFALMVLAYVLTFVIPGGSYTRIEDANGNMIIDQSVPFAFVQGGIPFWQWILSPVLVLFSGSGGTLIAVIIFLLVIGGVFNSLNRCGLMQYMLNKIAAAFGGKKYRLMAVIILFFMAMGSLIGSFEECVPLVPIVVGLASALGWDAVTGLAMSILAAGCGFAAGVFNPFTLGVAQELAGLPMFSGVWLRIVAFVCIYALLLGMVRRHAKNIERAEAAADVSFVRDGKMDRGLLCFVIILGIGIVLILSSSFLTFLRDYTMIIVAIMFLIGGIAAVLVCGRSAAFLGRTFLEGLVGILPAVLMIMMASSVKYILETAGVLDTILYGAVNIAGKLPGWLIILFIYLLVLVMNFFVASGSAKAFMLIPLIVPLAQIFGIPAQLCILAFVFGDGFSNVFYPTNPVLLISLGLADLSYGKWFRWSWKFQAINFMLTSALLFLGLAVGYGA